MDDPESVVSNLELQLSELELLRSMFSDANDVRPDDPSLEADIIAYIESATEKKCPPPTSLSYVVSVTPGARLHVEATAAYPSVETAELYLKTDFLGREEQASLNRELSQHLEESVGVGDLIVGVAVSWIQEREECFLQTAGAAGPVNTVSPPKKDLLSFTRLWIYSHHIYSKIKRRDILGLASEHGLTGFSMPGKPGVICLEGYSRDCSEAWATIR